MDLRHRRCSPRGRGTDYIRTMRIIPAEFNAVLKSIQSLDGMWLKAGIKVERYMPSRWGERYRQKSLIISRPTMKTRLRNREYNEPIRIFFLFLFFSSIFHTSFVIRYERRISEWKWCSRRCIPLASLLSGFGFPIKLIHSYGKTSHINWSDVVSFLRRIIEVNNHCEHYDTGTRRWFLFSHEKKKKKVLANKKLSDLFTGLRKKWKIPPLEWRRNWPFSIFYDIYKNGLVSKIICI